MPNLKDLPSDIYSLFDPENDHVISDENLESFCTNLKDLLRVRLGKQSTDRGPLRFSGLGRPNRQIWFDAHPIKGGKEPLTPQTFMKFLYGDIIEQMLVFLSKEAGHEVRDEQGKVEVDGVTGSIDCIIDGTVVDVKSASSYGYQKFNYGKVTEDDPFGYVAQLSGYSTVLTPDKDAAWLAMDKVSGAICISPLPAVVIRQFPPAQRIAELREIIASETPPSLCYEPVPDGKSGNLKLGTGCSYCPHKHRCHPNLRTFLYSTGPRYLTAVGKTPDVPEMFGSFVTDEA